MDKIRKEIKGIKTKLDAIEPSLTMCCVSVSDVERTQEYVEHRLEVNENLEKRILLMENYMNTLHKHLNETITRVNAIHMYLKELRDEDLLCHEKIEDSDDDMLPKTYEKTEP